MVDAQWQVGLRTTHGILFSARFRQMRQALSRQLSDTGLLVSRSVSGDGVCTIDLPRKSARHRNLFEIGPAETLSHGISRSHCTQHTGRRQPQTRLAHLRRLCTNTHPARAKTLSRQAVRSRSGRDGLCSRFDDHRSVSLAVSLGHVSTPEGSRQASHVARSTRQYPLFSLRFARKNARRKHPGRTVDRTGARSTSWTRRTSTMRVCTGCTSKPHSS